MAGFARRHSLVQLLAMTTVAATTLLAAACESPGRDEQDALDDTTGVVDANIQTGGDTSLHNDMGSGDAAQPVDLLAGGATVEIGKLASEIAAWECKRIVGCGCGVPGQPKPEQAACEAKLAPAIAKTWGAGGLVVNADDVAPCLAALESRSATCDIAKLTTLTPCLAALRWPGKSGDKCGTGSVFLCSDGGACESGTCTGAPLSQLAPGAKCGNPFVCGDAECLKDAGGIGHCQAPLATGKTCTADAECLLPGRCIDGQCAMPGSSGATCAKTEACAPGLACDGGKCGVPATCTSGTPCGNGGVCVTDGDGKNASCQPPVCADYLATP